MGWMITSQAAQFDVAGARPRSKAFVLTDLRLTGKLTSIPHGVREQAEQEQIAS